jgi:hypothetical protein
MKKLCLLLVLLSTVSLISCKSNLEAYANAFQKLKGREEAQKVEATKTEVEVAVDTTAKDSTILYSTEVWKLILGKPENIGLFNVVTGTFMNKTNAGSFYERMKGENRPAALVQNQDLLYRIVVATFATAEAAEQKKSELLSAFPKAQIVIWDKP